VESVASLAFTLYPYSLSRYFFDLYIYTAGGRESRKTLIDSLFFKTRIQFAD